MNKHKEYIAKKNESLFIMPNITTREVFLVSGGSGQGKTWFMCSYLKLFIQLKKMKLIYLSSNDHTKDNSFIETDMVDKFTTLDPNYLYDLITSGKYDEAKVMEILKDSYLIIDDIDHIISDKKDMQKVLWSFINRSMEKFRRANVNLMILTHLSTQGMKTRLLLSELTRFCVFPDIRIMNDRIFTYFTVNKDVLAKIVNSCVDKHANIVVDVRKRFIMSNKIAQMITY